MAAAPTGDILKFIEAFNKDFDAYLVKGQEIIDKGKATLEELKKISETKEGPFPRGNTDVKTIGDLIAYAYDIDKGIDKTPVLKPTNLYPPILDDDNLADVKGFEKDVGKAGKDKIRQIEAAIRQSGRRFEFRGEKYPRNSSTPFLNALKEKKGPNPDLWSPGQYAFDVFMLEMSAAVKKPENYDGIFSIEYQNELKEKTKSFTYSVASFSPDGRVDEAADDIGYAAFYEIMLKIEKDLEYYGIGQLLDIQEVFGAPTGTALAGGGNPPKNPASFPSLRAKYIDGKLEELKQNKSQNKLELSRGETINEIFYGNYEFLGLYLAFKQAGDAYAPVTLPLDEAKYPGSSVFQEVEEPEKKPEEPVAPTTSGVGPTTSGVVEEKTGEKEAEIKGYVGKIKPIVKGLENGFAIEAKKDLPDFSVYVGDPEEWKKKGIITEENEEPAQDDYQNLDGASYEDDEYVEDAYSGSEAETIEMIIKLEISDASGDVPDTPATGGGEGGAPEGGTGEEAKLGKQQNAGGTGHRKFQKQRTINGRLCKNGELPSDLMVPIPWQKGQFIEKNAFKQLDKLNEAFKAEFNKNMPIICGFRSIDVQDKLFNWPLYESTGKKQTYQGNACAPPGTSLHGWGQAVDIDGLHGANKSVAGNKKFAWLMENSKKYNWIKPAWANTGSGPSYEPWHFEYTGTDLFKP